MEIIYPSTKLYKNNLFLSIEESSVEPVINLDCESKSFYTLLMFDPEAVGGNKIHWLIVNITNNNIFTGNTIVNYKGPKPPKDSGKHHYVLSLFRQHKIIDPKKIIPFLKTIIDICRVIIRIANQILRVISFFSKIISIFLLLVKIFWILRLFFFGIHIPNLVTTVGVTTTVSNTLQEIIKEKGFLMFLKRLKQINI